ncbi:MAG: hypothetical protein JWM11_5493 [Planctomycetaceae bacterium]|nr:hypothetical protein [Planctomycetaceae bacterium]
MSTITPTMTVEELVRFPDDGYRREIRKGELTTMPPPGLVHGLIIARIAGKLFSYVEECNLGLVVSGDTGFLLAENTDTLLAPDVAYISKARESRLIMRRGYFLGAPDLVVEVISPSDRIQNVHDKVDEFIQFGALEGWVVNPRTRTITIHTATQEPIILTDSMELADRKLLPKFACSVADLLGKTTFES